jgi:hypothetical protein
MFCFLLFSYTCLRVPLLSRCMFRELGFQQRSLCVPWAASIFQGNFRPALTIDQCGTTIILKK